MRIISKSPGQTLELGKKISGHLQKGDIVCLYGALGTGKTVLTKGIASGLGIKKDAVISPTFVLVRRHAGVRLPLNHFDFYRLNSVGDILVLGYEEYFYGDAVSVVEWAEKLDCLLPDERLDISLSSNSPASRLIEFSAQGARYRQLLENIRETIGH